MQDTIDRILIEVKTLMKDHKTSHDFDHTLRVYNLCMHIGKIENADLDILKIASLLHDICRKIQDDSKGKICHAEAGSELAKDILLKYNLSHNVYQNIIHCIKTHRYRGKHIPESLEAKVLFDADKLDSIGAVGISRALMFASEVGAKLHDKNIDIAATKPYTEDDTAYREYLVKLRFVKDKMLTGEGKRLALERHDFMELFFDRLNKEVDGIL